MNIKGIVPIIATPFLENGDIDYESLRKELQYMKTIGCNGATLFGIAGEYYKLTDSECEEMIQVTVDECKRINLPCVISCTPHSTYAAIQRAKIIENKGADCMMLLPPFFLKPSGKELMDHIKAVASSVNIPVMLQYAPEQTGVPITPQALAGLAKACPNMSYFKIECKPAGPYITTLLNETNGMDLKIFAGNAGYQMIETFDRGAIGAMPGCSMSELYIKIYQAYIAGNKKEAIDYHEKLLPILNHIRQNVDMIIHYEKEILYRRGIISTPVCRHPEYLADSEMNELFELYYSRIKDLIEK